jgi:hypothetical protein
MYQPHSKVLPKPRSRQCIRVEQIPIFGVEKLKKADEITESQIYDLKDIYNTEHIYFSKTEMPKWPSEQRVQLRIPEFGKGGHELRVRMR